jgi:uncharacterized low-complexity protein
MGDKTGPDRRKGRETGTGTGTRTEGRVGTGTRTRARARTGRGRGGKRRNDEGKNGDEGERLRMMLNKV